MSLIEFAYTSVLNGKYQDYVSKEYLIFFMAITQYYIDIRLLSTSILGCGYICSKQNV